MSLWLFNTKTQRHEDTKKMSFTKNTVVWASAGTGKTRKLVEVYLELLDQGIDPLRIVAVTFTEKAAAEIDRKSTRLNSSHSRASRMPSSA